jgi:hypothetical protein
MVPVTAAIENRVASRWPCLPVNPIGQRFFSGLLPKC